MRAVIVSLFLAVLPAGNAQCALRVILVRHGEVREAGTDPPLSARGESRARALASMLRDANVGAIYTGESLSTRQTAQPSAARFHLRPERLDSSRSPALLDPARRRASGTVLVVGDSKTI